jgi:hypothetical protein
MRVATLVLLVPSMAAASDGFGIVTYLVGIPLLVVVAAAFAIMSVIRPSATLRIAAWLVFVSTLLFCLYLIPDALHLFDRGFRRDSLITIAFFALLALVCWQFVGLAQRRA